MNRDSMNTVTVFRAGKCALNLSTEPNPPWFIVEQAPGQSLRRFLER